MTKVYSNPTVKDINNIKFTKAHYEMLAAIFNKHEAETFYDDWGDDCSSSFAEGQGSGYDIAITNIMNELSDMLEKDNPSFDRTKFIEACQSKETT